MLLICAHVAVSVSDAHDLRRRLARHFDVTAFPHSLNIAAPGSALRVQVQLDSRYASFVAAAEVRGVLGGAMRVARIEDMFQSKVRAASDPDRRPGKCQNALAQIARLLESRHDLRPSVPEPILVTLV